MYSRICIAFDVEEDITINNNVLCMYVHTLNPGRDCAFCTKERKSINNRRSGRAEYLQKSQGDITRRRNPIKKCFVRATRSGHWEQEEERDASRIRAREGMKKTMADRISQRESRGIESSIENSKHIYSLYKPGVSHRRQNGSCLSPAN